MVKKPMRGVIGCAATLSILGCNVPKSAAIKVDLNRTNTTTTNAPNAPSDGGTPTVATGSTVVMNTPSGTSTSSQNSSAVASGTNLTPSPVQTVVAPTLVSTAAQELAQLVSQFDPRLTAYTSNQYTLSNVEKRAEACANDYLSSVKVTVANKVFTFASDKLMQTCMNQTPALVSSGSGAYDYSSRYMIQVSCDGNVEMYNGKSLTDTAFLNDFCAQGTKASVAYSVELTTTEKNTDGSINRKYRRIKTLSSIDGQGPCTYTIENGVRNYTNCAWSDKAWDKGDNVVYQAIAQFPGTAVACTAVGCPSPGSVATTSPSTTPTTGTGGTGTTGSTPTTGTGTAGSTPGATTTGTPVVGSGQSGPLPFTIVINNLRGFLTFDPAKPGEVKWELGAPGVGSLTSGVIKTTSLPTALQLHIMGLKGHVTVPFNQAK